MLRGDQYSGLEWLDIEQEQPSEQEVADEVDRLNVQIPLGRCSAEAKRRIAEVDWAVLPDVDISNRASFEAYRAALRVLIFNPVADPQWPERPEAEWT